MTFTIGSGSSGGSRRPASARVGSDRRRRRSRSAPATDTARTALAPSRPEIRRAVERPQRRVEPHLVGGVQAGDARPEDVSFTEATASRTPRPP